MTRQTRICGGLVVVAAGSTWFAVSAERSWSAVSVPPFSVDTLVHTPAHLVAGLAVVSLGWWLAGPLTIHRRPVTRTPLVVASTTLALAGMASYDSLRSLQLRLADDVASAAGRWERGYALPLLLTCLAIALLIIGALSVFARDPLSEDPWWRSGLGRVLVGSTAAAWGSVWAGAAASDQVRALSTDAGVQPWPLLVAGVAVAAVGWALLDRRWGRVAALLAVGTAAAAALGAAMLTLVNDVLLRLGLPADTAPAPQFAELAEPAVLGLLSIVVVLAVARLVGRAGRPVPVWPFDPVDRSAPART